MLNPKTNQRELAYIVEIKDTRTLDGYDNVHYIKVLGWWCVATKKLKTGDKGVYFEIDSLLPRYDKRFNFMERKKYRVKTIKICGVISQGLVLPLSDFPELKRSKVGDFVTDTLKVSLYEHEVKDYKPQNKVTSFQKAMDRHKRFFNFLPVKYMLKYGWFRSLMGKVFIHKKDRLEWPDWLPKTGLERIQNIPQLFETSTITEVVGENEIEVSQPKRTKYILEEKVDGIITSFIMDKKDVYYIGIHNTIIYSSKDKDSKSIADGNKYIKNNVCLEMGERYHMEDILFQIKIENKLNTIAIQGESYGSGVQKRTYSKRHGEQDFVVFHIWFNNYRLPVQDMVKICERYSLPHVTVYNDSYTLPNTVEELINLVDSTKSGIDGGDIEGFVIYSLDGQQNFKCVSPTYLLKYHG